MAGNEHGKNGGNLLMAAVPEEKRRKSNIHADLLFLFLCAGLRTIKSLERAHRSKHDVEEEENYKKELDAPARPPASASLSSSSPAHRPCWSSSSSSPARWPCGSSITSSPRLPPRACRSSSQPPATPVNLWPHYCVCRSSLQPRSVSRCYWPSMLRDGASVK